MEKRATLIVAILLGLCSVAWTQTLQMKVTYICNGERLIIDGCDIHDMSDTAHCFVAHPDRPLHNDMMAYTNETRGAMNKLIPTCKQPSAAEVKAHQDFEKAVAARQQAAIDEQKKWFADHSPKPQGPSEDQQAVNRCVSAGRSLFECLGETMKKEVGDMMGVVDPRLKKLMTTEPGLRMNGVFKGNNFSLLFPSDQFFALIGCAPLVPDQHPYEIVNTGNSVVVKVQNQPQELTFTFMPDGRLIGPGVVPVTGRVQVGTRYGTRTWSDGRTEPISEPVYEARTVRCDARALALAGPAPKVGLGMITDLAIFSQSEKSVTGSKDFKVPAGLRMIGDYTSPTGFSVEFRLESATIGCGQAFAAHSYVIQNTGRGLVARIGDDASPIALVLQPNGTIGGSGVVRVAGRTIQGTSRDANDNERVVFGATNGQCAIGTLALKGETPSEIERGAAAARASMSGPVGVTGGAAPVPSASLVSPTNATVPQAGGAEAYFAKGRSYFGAKDFANAASAYREALRVRPNYPEASVWLSLSLMGMKKFPEAQTALQQAIRLQPNHPLLHYSLGLVDLKLGRREEAMQEYRTLQRLHPDGAKALYAVITAPKQ